MSWLHLLRFDFTDATTCRRVSWLFYHILQIQLTIPALLTASNPRPKFFRLLRRAVQSHHHRGRLPNHVQLLLQHQESFRRISSRTDEGPAKISRYCRIGGRTRQFDATLGIARRTGSNRSTLRLPTSSPSRLVSDSSCFRIR